MSNSFVSNSSLVIRARRDADISSCADLVREVHSTERYPRFLPADIVQFLNPPDPFGCWVADLDGEVAGHVALVPRGLPAATEIAASALGKTADQLAVVGRLFVSRRAGGRGAGRLLLDIAAAEARSRGLHPSSTWTSSCPQPPPSTSPQAGPARASSRSVGPITSPQA
jgi:GNAT superfamily N-acetyltransferase